jgi:hypothetical protein
MNKNTFLSFLLLFLGGILLISVAFSLPSNINKLLTASLQFISPQCPFHVGLIPNQVKTNAELSLRQEAILLKLFFTQAVLDSRGVAICKEADSLNTCLARFQNLCYQQGKCQEQYDGSNDAVLTSEIQSYLCIIWNQRYAKIFDSWTKVTSLFAQKNTSVPSWLNSSRQSFITYQQQVNESVKQVINPEDRAIKEKPVYIGSFKLGEQINLIKPEIKSNPTEVSASGTYFKSSLVPQDRSAQMDINKPTYRISQNKDGSYNLEFFTNPNQVQPGIMGRVIIKEGNNIIWQSDPKWLGFGDIEIPKGVLDPTKTYAIALENISDASYKPAPYSFQPKLLKDGGQVIDNILVKSFNTNNSYFNYFNAAKSGNTLALNFDFNDTYGQYATHPVAKMVITYPDKSTQTINVSRDPTTQTRDLTIDCSKIDCGQIKITLFDINNHPIEGKTVIIDGDKVLLYTDFKGGTGWGSVYDPIVTYSTSGGPQGYSISIHAEAAGASQIQVIDASNPDPNTNVVATYNSGDVYITGSQNKYKQGYSYYVVYYDQNGNIAKTQKFIVTDKSGHLEIQDIIEPTLNKGCGGFQIKVQGTIDKIIIDGVTYNLEQIKNDPNKFSSDFLKSGILGIKGNVGNITVTYIDSLGVEQSATFKVAGSDIVMTEFSNKLVQQIPPSDEQVGKTVTLNNGAVLTYYKTYKNNLLGDYYVKIDNYKDLEIESISFGYAPYDDPSYIQQVVKQFNETGILPAGAQITFRGKNGGGVTINTAGEGESVGKYGPIYVRNDTTIKTEEEKVVVDKDTGTITIPITKVNDENTKKELENNNLYNDPIIQSLINEAKNDSNCKTHTCGFSRGAYTVTTNPSTGKITVEVDKAAQEAADKAAKEAADKAAAEKEEQRIKNRENYEKALDNMAGMTEELKNKLMDEYDAKNPPENPPPVGGGGGGGGKIYYTQ